MIRNKERHMKDELWNILLIVVIATMFLMGQEVIPRVLFFENQWIRLAVFFLAFMNLFYRFGLWPTGSDDKERASSE